MQLTCGRSTRVKSPKTTRTPYYICAPYNVCLFCCLLAADELVHRYICIHYACTYSTHRWSPNRLSRLVWKIISSSLIWCKICCTVTPPWPIYLAADWHLRWKSQFFTMFSRFVRKLFKKLKSFQWTGIGKLGMGFPAKPKLAPRLSPFSPLGV